MTENYVSKRISDSLDKLYKLYDEVDSEEFKVKLVDVISELKMAQVKIKLKNKGAKFMDQGQRIFIIGILKGIASQNSDPDVSYALGEAIDILGKMAQGWELVDPNVGVPAPREDDTEETTEE